MCLCKYGCVVPACPRMRVACPDGRCILRTWLCDGYADCQNGTDESNCGEIHVCWSSDEEKRW